ncbi:hypothetical protein [Deinococcus koreensis]|uniref:Uncharacterized protein n=1 Tax=Deinococcus koreensis TaxID=2054903 RepID=A0A2K3URV4_9DEIO|nr:hypothetical protein [Deinococcus koreensis]PNY79276.1 hypothetical protein CVO96_20405 [Deinococcus koreensis]
MPRLPLILALLTLSAALAQPAPVPTPTDLARERELTLRALSSDYGPVALDAQLLVGRLPPRPLGPLPVPPGGRLLGSVLRESRTPDAPSSQSVFYDSPAAPAQVRTALSTALAALGWTRFPGNPGPFGGGGFQAAEPPEYLAYYRLAQLVSLNAQVGRVGAVTRVTLSVTTDRNLREQLGFRERMGGEPQSNLPALRPPAGTTVQPSGTGGGGGSWSSFASVQSPLDLTGLLDTYGIQLKAAGWTLLNRSVTGKTVTSLWSFADRDRNELTGVLTVRENAPGQYSAQLASLAFRN